MCACVCVCEGCKYTTILSVEVIQLLLRQSRPQHADNSSEDLLFVGDLHTLLLKCFESSANLANIKKKSVSI